MNRRPFRPEEEDTGKFLVDVFKIALGVFIGGLAAAFAYEAILTYRAEEAMRKAAQEIKAQAARTNAEIAKQNELNQQAKEEERQHMEGLRAAQALEKRLESERRQRKEDAWARFHQPSPNCKLDSGTTACANEYMAARKRFESQYVDR
ncbi:hypothetical protein [Acidovorax sp. Root568]|uniref:hypothetical protein n=1 Tax=Acidovorax sp. Root568 TaxID=1736565 RepID=UPI0006FD38EC|nr:hypothetical protein [Acidovorax sp. Root568]KRA06608.1 hypothetical protein ASD75_15450 [Acidovorax sp. Root568]